MIKKKEMSKILCVVFCIFAMFGRLVNSINFFEFLENNKTKKNFIKEVNSLQIVE